ncbi:MAG: hypothetical protein OH337_04155 [Candidatus Parvarchaeota archaeon]|nr:hypothetical protein [Candidatus Haiyanarchaeum thermophilum]
MDETKPPEAPPERPPERSPLASFLESLKGQKIDPITSIMILSELRRMEREEEEWRLRRNALLNQPKLEEIVEKIVEILQLKKGKGEEEDLKSILREMQAQWEKRFLEYQSNIEKLILGRKLEESERTIKELKEKIEKTEEEKSREKMIAEKVAEAVKPIEETIEKIRGEISALAKNMPPNKAKSLESEIESVIDEEVTGFIRDKVKTAVKEALTGEAAPPPSTGESKTDVYLRWAERFLKRIERILEKYGSATPPQPAGFKPIPEEVKVAQPIPSEGEAGGSVKVGEEEKRQPS